MPRRPRRPCMNPTCTTLIDGVGYCFGCTRSMVSGTKVTLVAGPPCAGKSTYVAQHRQPGDLVVDYDELSVALGGQRYDPGPGLRPFVLDARDAVLTRLRSGRHELARAWVIHSAPTRAERAVYHDAGDAVVLLLTDAPVCLDRAGLHRPDSWAGHIRAWFDRYEPDPRDAIPPTSRTVTAGRVGAGG
ncbi:hypothetical protein AB0N38_33160 [Micromonospora aurantiaca]|uniref:hypothetical protein n=1 Tax=Micromonospora aurantiaca (nom. illeg.) TaxID=47850 RepID=UPI003440B38F